MILRALSTRSYEKMAYLKRAQDLYERGLYAKSYHNPYHEYTSPPQLRNETMYSAKNDGQQASNHPDEYYSDDLVPSDNDDANNNVSLAVRNQSPSLHNLARPTLNEEETSQKNETRWLNEQHSPRQILARPFNEVNHAELIPPQPATNILPVTRDSMEMSKEFDHGERSILASEGQKSTKISVDGDGDGDREGIIDFVDVQDKQLHEKEKSGK